MDDANGATTQQQEAVHEDDYGIGGAPTGCRRSKCGVMLGAKNPHITQNKALVTCVKCKAPVTPARVECGFAGCSCGEPLNHPMNHEAELYASFPQLEPRGRKPRMSRGQSLARVRNANRGVALMDKAVGQ